MPNRHRLICAHTSSQKVRQAPTPRGLFHVPAAARAEEVLGPHHSAGCCFRYADWVDKAQGR